MQKLQQARDNLLAAGLGIKAKELLSFAEKGRIVSLHGNAAMNSDFRIEYTGHLIVTDFAGNPQDLLFVVSRWVDENVQNRTEETLQFHVDLISHKSADVSLRLELSDTVSVTKAENGSTLDFQIDADVDTIDMGTFFPGLP